MCIRDRADIAEKLASFGGVIAAVRSIAFDGRRVVVLGTAPIRGIECWRLAELGAPGGKADVFGSDAREAAGRGEFHGIAVVDKADGNKRRRIDTSKIIYVRTSSTPAVAKAVA